MNMRTLFIVLALAGLTLPSGLRGQESPAAAKPSESGDEEKVSSPTVPAAKPLPPFSISAGKVYAGDTFYSSLIKIDTGKEWVAFSVPAQYRYQAAESGREIVVYLDQSRQSWAKFQFHASSFPEFTYDAVRPLVDDSFGDASPLMATTYAGGRTILSFTAEAGTANNPKQVRVHAVPCQAGTLTVTTVVYQKEAKVPFFKVKQMVDSLQFAKSEKELKSTTPSTED